MRVMSVNSRTVNSLSLNNATSRTRGGAESARRALSVEAIDQSLAAHLARSVSLAAAPATRSRSPAPTA